LDEPEEPAAAAEADKYSLFTIWGSSQATSLHPSNHAPSALAQSSSAHAAGRFSFDATPTMGMYPHLAPAAIDATGELRTYMARLEARVTTLEQENRVVLQQLQRQQLQQQLQQQQLEAALAAMSLQHQHQHQHYQHQHQHPVLQAHAPLPRSPAAASAEGVPPSPRPAEVVPQRAGDVGEGPPFKQRGEAQSGDAPAAPAVADAPCAASSARLPLPHAPDVCREDDGPASASADTLKVHERLSTLEGRQTSLQKKIAGLDLLLGPSVAAWARSIREALARLGDSPAAPGGGPLHVKDAKKLRPLAGADGHAGASNG